MSLTVVKGLQSEIFVPVTPPPVWAPVKKELKDMTIALATAAGVHHKDQKRFNLAGDFTWRKITDKMPSDELMVSHGGYDNSDVNKDINCMFPIDRIHELAKEGFIKACAPVHAGFMGRERLKPQEFLQLLLLRFRRLFVRPVPHVRLLRVFLWELTLVNHTTLRCRQAS